MSYIIDKMRFGFNDIGEDFVVFDMVKDTYHVLNESAKDIVGILMMHEKCKMEDLLAGFIEIYDVKGDDLLAVEQDIKEILDKFLEVGLIRIEQEDE